MEVIDTNMINQNDGIMLSEAASKLLVNNADLKYMRCPRGFNEEYWFKLLNQPLKNRMMLAIELISMHIKLIT